jgi:hypothetical protein
VDLDSVVSIERGSMQLYPPRRQVEGHVRLMLRRPPGGAAPPALPPPQPQRQLAAGAQQGAERLRDVASTHDGGGGGDASTRRVLGLAAAGQRTTAVLMSSRRALPPPGQGLNQPALLTFRRMAVRQRHDRRTVDAFRGTLLETSARLGGVFVHYDADEGVWMLKLDRWS